MSRMKESQAVRIPVRGANLDGDLTVPGDAHGLVLFAHGSGSSRRSPRNQYVARVLQKAGIATLLFDLLTSREEQEEYFTRHLRFDIGMLADGSLKRRGGPPTGTILQISNSAFSAPALARLRR